MPELSSLDASILALIADVIYSRPKALSTAARRRIRALAKRIQDPVARQAAEAVISGATNVRDFPREVQDMITHLRDWAERNRRVHGPLDEKTTT